MFKKHMTPLSKGGATISHKGKGSQMTGMPDRREISQLSGPQATLNDYAKASPASAPAGAPSGGIDLED